ncbi:N(6)-adenine-specific methyltransferase METTL4 [Octopus vulgaris]|uniref:N(6)-adenine-specific methyltransferase METTL4 n=1 Tax=Octopus vulgaris TaxID=6645 RepID=A0AA36BM70_OCTVU|nr:N(6)-adenine-specific methyltransferase METTL4 [Octopus vulgaris]
MSIICRNEQGWVVCHSKAVQDVYRRCREEPPGSSTRSYRWKTDMFKIHSPFLMDTQFLKLRSDPGEHRPQIKKRKRRISDLNVGEIQAKEYHEKVKTIITGAHQTLVELAKKQGYFVDLNSPPVDNNIAARQASKLEGPADTLIQSCEDKDIRSQLALDEFYKISHTNELCVTHENPSFLKVQYNGEIPQIVTIANHKYLLPSKSTFLLSNLDTFKEIYPHAGGPFDVILIDPPWQNKSVKRLKSYWCESDTSLENLDVPQLAAPNCLVVVWVTNRRKHQEFVLETLFKKWNVQDWVTWFWLKVTRSGEPVNDMDSSHKKPYEVLILGRHKKGDPAGLNDVRCSPDGPKSLPESRVILTIPCSLHSKKPPLTEILAEFLPDNPRCLELFARNLWPGWTSWGNEVFKHQHLDYFEDVEDQESTGSDKDQGDEG